MALKALPGYVILKNKEDDLAITLAKEAKGQGGKGEVIAIGDEYRDANDNVMDSPVDHGDIVGYKQYQSYDYNYQGETYKAVHFSDLLLVEED